MIPESIPNDAERARQLDSIRGNSFNSNQEKEYQEEEKRLESSMIDEENGEDSSIENAEQIIDK